MAPSTSPSRTRPYRFAAALTAAAGAVHLAGGATHVGEGLLLGLAFVAVGWGQLLLAARLARSTEDRRWVLATVGLHLAALASWAVSRTAGLPLLHPQPEPVAAADLLTVLFEVTAVGFLAWRLARPESAPGHGRRVTATLAATWALVLGGSAVAVADLGSSEHGHGSSEHGHGTTGEASARPAHDSDHGDDDSRGGTPAGDDPSDETNSDGASPRPEEATSTDAEQASPREHLNPTPTESPTRTTGDTPTSHEIADDGHDHTH